jgi:hypothetical protein
LKADPEFLDHKSEVPKSEQGVLGQTQMAGALRAINKTKTKNRSQSNLGTKGHKRLYKNAKALWLVRRGLLGELGEAQ